MLDFLDIIIWPLCVVFCTWLITANGIDIEVRRK